MKSNSYLKISTLLSLGGFLFAGYMSSVKFFTNTCALSEPCPYFLGYPACYFGLGMFTMMLATGILGLTKIISPKLSQKIILAVSVVGILFAGNFVVQEFLTNGFRIYKLGLPTCVYGLIFYILIFLVSLKAVSSKL